MFALMLLTACLVADDKSEKLDTKEIAALKKKVAGKVAVDRKSGLVQIAYDFRAAKQGGDFQSKQTTTDAKGGLVLKPSTSVEHIVPWKTVQVEAKVQISKMVGPVMTASESKAGFHLGGDNLNTVYLVFPNQPSRYQVIIPDRERAGRRTLRLELSKESSLVAFDAYQVSEPTKLGDAGKIEFHGGTYGHAFRTIVFRGRLDPAWLKESEEKPEK